MVTLHAGFNVEGTRSGYSAPNNKTTTAATTIAAHMNAHPSEASRHTNTTAASCAATATASTPQVQFLPCTSCVHTPKPATTAVTSTDNHRANRSASSRIDPEVLSAMNIAP